LTSRLAAVLLSFLATAAAAKTIDVEFGKEFRLKKGEIARFDGGRGTLRITNFINSPCPKGARCVWSGLAAHYELTQDGKAVPPNARDAPYDVTVKDSDYKSFAVFIVDDPEAACSRPKAGHRGECLRSLARRRAAPALCRKIDDERTRGLCLEDLAEELKDAALCAGVAAPTQYCLYVKAKKNGDLAACDAITTWNSRVRCIKELSTEGGGGPRSCSELAPEAAKRCLEIALGPNP